MGFRRVGFRAYRETAEGSKICKVLLWSTIKLFLVSPGSEIEGMAALAVSTLDPGLDLRAARASWTFVFPTGLTTRSLSRRN